MLYQHLMFHGYLNIFMGYCMLIDLALKKLKLITHSLNNVRQIPRIGRLFTSVALLVLCIIE